MKCYCDSSSWGITRRVCVFRHCTNPSRSILDESMEFKSSESRCLSVKISILQLFTDPLPPQNNPCRANISLPVGTHISPRSSAACMDPHHNPLHETFFSFLHGWNGPGGTQTAPTVISRSVASLAGSFHLLLICFFSFEICFSICDLVYFPVKDYPTRTILVLFFFNPAPSDPCVMARNAD